MFARVSVYTTVSPTLAVETLDVFEIESSASSVAGITVTLTVEETSGVPIFEHVILKMCVPATRPNMVSEPPLTDLAPFHAPVAVQLVGLPVVVHVKTVELTGSVIELGLADKVTLIADIRLKFAVQVLSASIVT